MMISQLSLKAVSRTSIRIGPAIAGWICLVAAWAGVADDFEQSVRHTLVESGHYRISNGETVRRYISVNAAGGFADGTPVELQADGGDAGQQWWVDALASGASTVQLLDEAFWLAGENQGDGWNSGDPVHINAWISADEPEWVLRRAGNGLTTVEAGSSGLGLTRIADTNGAAIQLAALDGLSEQKWLFELRNNVQSPAIQRGTDGDLLVFFKQYSSVLGSRGRLVASGDDGASWAERYVFTNEIVYGPTFFTNSGSLYMFYIDSADNKKLQLKKSTDHGYSWTNYVPAAFPDELSTCGGADVLRKDGILYYGFIDRGGSFDQTGPDNNAWSSDFRIRVASCNEIDDLTDPSSWTISDPLECPAEPAVAGTRKGWLEPNCVAGPDGRVWVIARVDHYDEGNVAAVLKLSEDRTTLEFTNQYPAPGNETGFLDAPWAGSSKFHFVRDEVSDRWLVASSPFFGAPSANPRHPNVRNTLALYETKDLKNYRLLKTIADDDVIEDWALSAWHTGFQYPAFVIDGDDLHLVSRTAYNSFWNQHDANMGTYHVVENFRRLLDPDGELAAYRFNNTDGPGRDSSKMQGSAADLCGAAFTSAGRFGGAMVFDGIDDSLGLMHRVSPKLHRAKQVSVSFWMKNNSSYGVVYSSAIHTSLAGISLRLYSGIIRMSGRSIATDAFQSVDFAYSSVGQWHHVVALWDFENSAMRLWLDGQEQAGSGTVSFGNSEYTRGAPKYQDRIGRHYIPENGGFFRGLLDEIHIHRRALTQQEITGFFSGSGYSGFQFQLR